MQTVNVQKCLLVSRFFVLVIADEDCSPSMAILQVILTVIRPDVTQGGKNYTVVDQDDPM